VKFREEFHFSMEKTVKSEKEVPDWVERFKRERTVVNGACSRQSLTVIRAVIKKLNGHLIWGT